MKAYVVAVMLAAVTGQVWAGCESGGDTAQQLVCATWHTVEAPGGENVTYTADIVLPKKTGTAAVVQIREYNADGMLTEIHMNIGTFNCGPDAPTPSTFFRTEWIDYDVDPVPNGQRAFRDANSINYRGTSFPVEHGGVLAAIAKHVCPTH